MCIVEALKVYFVIRGDLLQPPAPYLNDQQPTKHVISRRPVVDIYYERCCPRLERFAAPIICAKWSGYDDDDVLSYETAFSRILRDLDIVATTTSS